MFHSYCLPLKNVTTIITTYIQSIIKGNRMNNLPKNHYPNYQYTFRWSRPHDSYYITHIKTEFCIRKHPETVEFWHLVKRFGMTSGFKLRLLLIEDSSIHFSSTYHLYPFLSFYLEHFSFQNHQFFCHVNNTLYRIVRRS